MKALITGITGQDGSYLAELLLEKGWEVVGVKRRSSSINTSRIDHIFNNIELVYGDLTDTSNMYAILKKHEPDVVYNLGAQSHVAVSFETPEYTANSDAVGVLRILEGIRNVNPDIKFYQASTSEMFGRSVNPSGWQNEETPFHPASPYGVAKLYGHWITKNYRESYGTFASSGILFNHESPRRGETFVTQKITNGLARIARGRTISPVLLGNVHAYRDWGHAKDYVRGMYLMMEHDVADDFVLATGEVHTVADFVVEAGSVFGMNVVWQDDVAIDLNDGKPVAKSVDRYKRPLDVEFLRGDATKARNELGWVPEIGFRELVEEMCEASARRL